MAHNGSVQPLEHAAVQEFLEHHQVFILRVLSNPDTGWIARPPYLPGRRSDFPAGNRLRASE